VLIVVKSILELNYLENKVVCDILSDILNWLKFDNQFDDSNLITFYNLIFNLSNSSVRANSHIMSNLPKVVSSFSMYLSNQSKNHGKDIHSPLFDYIYAESNKNSVNTRQLNDFLQFFIKFCYLTNLDVEKDNLYWFLIGRIMSFHSFGREQTNFTEENLNSIQFMTDLEELPKYLYKIIHSQSKDTSPNTVSKILFSYSFLVMKNFGMPYLMSVLGAWYDLEENVNYRYGFHLTYINLISRQFQTNAEMTLNFCSNIIFREKDPDLLIKVTFHLYDLGIGWKTIYPYIILPLIHNNELTSDEFKQKISAIYKIYFEDLMKSTYGKLLAKTEDLYLIFWSLSDRKQKKQLIIPLKKWLNSNNERSNTIKGIFLKSLILRTHEQVWVNILTNFYNKLGKMSVEILDDFDFHHTISVSNDSNENLFQLVNSKLNSFIRKDFCMACRRTLFSETKKNVLEKDYCCKRCKFSFCFQCISTWLSGETNIEERTCLGSALSGINHIFENNDDRLPVS
jgi:hypothetical protein